MNPIILINSRSLLCSSSSSSKFSKISAILISSFVLPSSYSSKSLEKSEVPWHEDDNYEPLSWSECELWEWLSPSLFDHSCMSSLTFEDSILKLLLEFEFEGLFYFLASFKLGDPWNNKDVFN